MAEHQRVFIKKLRGMRGRAGAWGDVRVWCTRLQCS